MWWKNAHQSLFKGIDGRSVRRSGKRYAEAVRSDALPNVEAGSNSRTGDISSGEYATMPLAPMEESDAPNEELRQAWEYYHTPRAQYPTAPGIATLRSLNQIITYDLSYGGSIPDSAGADCRG